MGFKFKRGARQPAIKANTKSLHERVAKDPKKIFGESFKIVDVRIIDIDPGSFTYKYYVKYTSGDQAGEYQYCVLTVFEDADSQSMALKV